MSEQKPRLFGCHRVGDDAIHIVPEDQVEQWRTDHVDPELDEAICWPLVDLRGPDGKYWDPDVAKIA